jgi:hypothetical protein
MKKSSTSASTPASSRRCHLAWTCAWTTSLVLAIAASACSGSSVQCRVGADCASGACSRDGICLASTDHDAGTPANPDAAESPAPDTGMSAPDGGVMASDDAAMNPDPDAGQPERQDATTQMRDGGTPGCLPNNDDTIEHNEVPVMAGLHGVFRIAQGATIDTAGTTDAMGAHHWDFTAMLSGDHRVEVTTDGIAGQWFAADYPDATYVSKLSDASDLLGVFKVAPGALQLLGVVSPSDGPSKTELTYDTPIDVLSYPVTVGKMWSTDSIVTGLTQGLLSNFSESYESVADFAGEVETPYGRFHALRVRTVLTRTVGFLITTIRTDLWVTDCFGTIVTIVSQNDESNDEFTSAAEIRRLAP